MIMCMCKPDEYSDEYYKNVIAVTNRYLCSRPYPEQIRRVCERHPKAVLVREKDLPEEEYIRLLESVKEICSRYGVCCIAHTYMDAALKCGIDSVHFPLGLLQEKAAHPVLLKRMRQIKCIGVSVHSVEEALLAGKMGADYITAGHIFATGCKPGAEPRGTEFLKQVCQAVTVPVYAIGGMTATKRCVESMILCGASGICLMSECMQW